MKVSGARFHFRDHGVMRARPGMVAGWFAAMPAGSASRAVAQAEPRPEITVDAAR